MDYFLEVVKMQYLGEIVFIIEWWVVMGNFWMVTATPTITGSKKSPGNCERKRLQIKLIRSLHGIIEVLLSRKCILRSCLFFEVSALKI